MGIKKRGAIYSVIALMLCVAVYLNWSYSRTPDDTAVDGGADDVDYLLGQSILVDSLGGEDENNDPIIKVDNISGAEQPEGGNDYFSKARLSRQKARDEAVGILNASIESANTNEEAREAANTNIQLFADNAMTESRIENLIIAKGYTDCVVFINDGGINVIVSKTEEGIGPADVAKIKDIVLSEAVVTADQIKIIETT